MLKNRSLKQAHPSVEVRIFVCRPWSQLVVFMLII